jgi:hypothetical protein
MSMLLRPWSRSAGEPSGNVIPAGAIPAASLWASDLFRQYGENAVAADAQYAGKVLEIEGTIRSA